LKYDGFVFGKPTALTDEEKKDIWNDTEKSYYLDTMNAFKSITK
jgi:hypothetical protein